MQINDKRKEKKKKPLISSQFHLLNFSCHSSPAIFNIFWTLILRHFTSRFYQDKNLFVSKNNLTKVSVFLQTSDEKNLE